MRPDSLLQLATANQALARSSPLYVSQPRLLPRLHLSYHPVTRLIGDHFRLPWTYSPPQTHPPDLISHPVLFWRLASLTGGRSRSFLLFFSRRGVFPTRGLGTCPVSVNRLPSVNGIWVTTRSRAGQRTSFFPTPVQNWWVCVFPVCGVCVGVYVVPESGAYSAPDLVIREKKRGGPLPSPREELLSTERECAHVWA